MGTSVPLIKHQRKAMLPYKQSVGELYGELDWFRDSILNENREEISTALKSLRDHLTDLEAMIRWNRE